MGTHSNMGTHLNFNFMPNSRDARVRSLVVSTTGTIRPCAGSFFSIRITNKFQWFDVPPWQLAEPGTELEHGAGALAEEVPEHRGVGLEEPAVRVARHRRLLQRDAESQCSAVFSYTSICAPRALCATDAY